MRRPGLLLRRQCGRDVPQATSALGRVEESALPRRLALGVQLRHTAEGGRSRARPASTTARPTGRLALALPARQGYRSEALEQASARRLEQHRALVGLGLARARVRPRVGVGVGIRLGVGVRIRVGFGVESRFGLGFGLARAGFD